jgi:hypothetical protein
MEDLSRIVAASMARHGCDAGIDHRRLAWSPWFRCELNADLLLVPSAPGIVALAEEIGVLGADQGSAHRDYERTGSESFGSAQRSTREAVGLTPLSTEEGLGEAERLKTHDGLRVAERLSTREGLGVAQRFSAAKSQQITNGALAPEGTDPDTIARQDSRDVHGASTKERNAPGPGASEGLGAAERLSTQEDLGVTERLSAQERLGVAQRFSAAKSQPKTPGALAPEGTERRLLAVFEIAEASDLGTALIQLFAPSSPQRDRLRSGRCFARFTPVADPAERQTATKALRDWLNRTAELPEVAATSAA